MGKKACVLILVIFLMPKIGLASSYMVVDQPDLQGSIILMGDLFDQGTPIRLIAQNSNIYLEENGTRTKIISDISGQVSAMAFGDLTGDLKNNIVIGTAEAGAIYVYQEENGVWYRTGQPLYLWDTITKLEVHDFNNDGWGDLAISSGQNVAQIFLSWEGKLYPFWKTAGNQRVVDWQVADLNRDGTVDLIYIGEEGYIAAITWDEQEFTVLWENYPWGQMESLVVLQQSSGPEWIGVTSQKMVYGWRWQKDEVVSSRHFHAADLGENLFYIPGQGLLSFSKKTGASLFELKSSSVVEKWRVPRTFASQAFYINGEFLLVDHGLNYSLLTPRDGNWRILTDQKDITNLVEIKEMDGQLYYNLQELATTLDFTVVKGHSWHFLKEGQYVTVKPETEEVVIAGLTIPNTNSLCFINDVLYCTSDFFPLLGWLFEHDQARQQIQLYPNWGWWLF